MEGLEAITQIVNRVDDLVWGVPLIISILATGVLLSAALRFRHLLHLGSAFRYVFHQAIFRASDNKLCCTAKVDCVATKEGRLVAGLPELDALL